MSQHFLLSRPAKTLSLAQVFRMSDAEAEAMFCKVRWPETEGKPVCPHCGGLDAYECRRPNGSFRFRCRACKKKRILALPLELYLPRTNYRCAAISRPSPSSAMK